MANHQIRSPIPGTFYRSAAPDQPPFKDIGDTVSDGDTIGLVEVMKSFHEVKADASGKVTAFLVENEDAVMAGQPLVELD